jgi:hypothetical protein
MSMTNIDPHNNLKENYFKALHIFPSSVKRKIQSFSKIFFSFFSFQTVVVVVVVIVVGRRSPNPSSYTDVILQ